MQQGCSDGDLRLVGGTTSLEGRVEICYSGVWGTVCDDHWDSVDAAVVCRQLGYSSLEATASISAAFGEGSDPIFLDNVNCNGLEERLFDCAHPGLEIEDCSHHEDAGVVCMRSCRSGDLRLVNGPISSSGRLEVCLNETWGTVCDTLWSEQDANVACRQLGYPPHGVASGDAYYGEGTGPILLGGLACIGNETRLIDCQNSVISTLMGCNSHANDAGLACQTGCTQNGAVRLVGGRSSFEGRVEVCISEVWGTVCADSWDENDANVVCRQAGFSSAAGMGDGALGRFGSGIGPIHMRNVTCLGSERSLLECSFSTTSNCAHSQDVGVMCSTNTLFAPLSVRVQGMGNSINVSWSAPRYNVSSIVRYRVTCASTDQQQPFEVEVNGEDRVNALLPDLQFYTQYTCCVEVGYVNSNGNSSSCSSGWTEEGVPGTPTGLAAMPSHVDCTSVNLQWSPPPTEQQNGIILGYSVTVMDSSGVIVSSFNTDMESVTISPLRCCSDYTYQVSARTGAGEGVASQLRGFRMNPYFDADMYSVSIGIVSADSITVHWRTQSSILEQQLRSVTVILTSECSTGIVPVQTQPFNVRPEEGNSITATGLDAFVPYNVYVSALLCEDTFELYNHTIVIQAVTEIIPPLITNTVRISPTTASFDISADSSFGNFEITYFTSIGISFDENNPVGVFSTNQSSINIGGLSPCFSYWAVVTATNCTGSISSFPQLIGLFEPVPFKILILVGDTTTCRAWVVEDFARKVLDIQYSISTALEVSSCGMSVPCVANSQLTCGDNASIADFEAQLVSTDSLSSMQQLECLDRWVQSMPQLDVAGIPFQILAPRTSPTDSSTPDSIPDIPVYVWPIIAVAVTGTVIAIILAVVIAATRQKKRSSPGVRENEYGSSDTVENPVFTDATVYPEPSESKEK